MTKALPMKLINLVMQICLLTQLLLIPSLAKADIQPSTLNDQRCKNDETLQNEMPVSELALRYRVARSLRSDEDTLAKDINDWSAANCVFDDGTSYLAALIGGADNFSKGRNWEENLARIRFLKQKFPDSAFVALVEARYWLSYAWNASGNGFASSVTPEGRRLFRERLEQAEKVLVESKPYASALPNWYSEMIQLQSLLDRPLDDRNKTFVEGTQKYKSYYPIYLAMMKFLLPKWGGSWGRVDDIIKWSVENTKATDGNAIYAIMYPAAFKEEPDGEKPFKNTLANWQKMQEGFEDIMKKYPNSKFNLNKFAMFACMAEDKDTFLKLRNKIGKDVILEVWPPKTSLELCEIKFGYAQ